MASDSYYATNALCEALAKSADADRSLCPTRGRWCLVYGTSTVQPKLLMLAVAVQDTHALRQRIRSDEKRLVDALEYFGKAAGLPVAHMRFALSEETLSRVGYRDSHNTPGRVLGMDEFAEQAFEQHGLSADKGAEVKPVKDRLSSGYHEWQRASLGNLTVSDIDLIRFTSEGDPHEIFELKRSFRGLNDWEPYRADYDNYSLLYRAVAPSATRVRIVYNVYTGSRPRRDIIDHVAVWEVVSDSPTFERLGIYSFEEFVAREYNSN